MKTVRVLYKREAIARRVRAVGRQISQDFHGQTLDVVGLLDNGFVFMADLVRALEVPVRYHFIRTEARDVIDPNTGKERREIFYSPEIEAEGKNILLVDGVLQSGITTDFLLRRIGLHQPRVVKVAVCVDKPAGRKLLLEADYCAFRLPTLASNNVVIGYGLSWDGLHGHLPYLGTLALNGGRARARRGKTRARRK